MLPTLREDDVLLVRWSPRRARVGRLAVVVLPGGRPAAVKRLVHAEPEGAWWVERDNPEEGVDSWLVGAVPAGDVLGIVLTRLWPRPGRPRAAPAPGAGAGPSGQG